MLLKSLVGDYISTMLHVLLESLVADYIYTIA